MCGIVGLFLKDPGLEPQLGAMLTGMLVTMTDRGPDSAGVAIYRRSRAGRARLTVQSANPGADFAGLATDLGRAVSADIDGQRKDNHMVLDLPSDRIADAQAALPGLRPGISIMSAGAGIEIYKDTGLPRDVAARFGIADMSGTHGIGHTRMATESSVTTAGAHPFSTGPDQCLVHNGSLSNHNSVRRRLKQAGMTFKTENDSEVAAAYLTHQMDEGADLAAAMQSTLTDLDGFFTFVVGTGTGFAVVRDPIACKPAVMAETGAYVAFGSEYRALVGLPGIDAARVWEPEPATVYFWER